MQGGHSAQCNVMSLSVSEIMYDVLWQVSLLNASLPKTHKFHQLDHCLLVIASKAPLLLLRSNSILSYLTNNHTSILIVIDMQVNIYEHPI